ncbi:MAG: hypothetical protein HYS14_06570 [Candidatus Rokubacteria bacterium]|nr:hypothetical protein [Candidatus Rokubacteria bacterium]
MSMKRWEQRIEEARDQRVLGLFAYPRFTAEDRRLAAEWMTCAVGEVRKRYGIRMDRILGRLGTEFYRAVYRNQADRAAELREAIDEYALTRKRQDWERKSALRDPIPRGAPSVELPEAPSAAASRVRPVRGR